MNVAHWIGGLIAVGFFALLLSAGIYSISTSYHKRKDNKHEEGNNNHDWGDQISQIQWKFPKR